MSLASNAVLQHRAANFQQVLKDQQRAVYTAAPIKEGRYFVDWPQHLHRLQRSYQLLDAELGAKWQEATPSTEEISLSVLRSLRVALQGWDCRRPSRSEDAHLSALIVLQPELPVLG